jgi:Ice-binding-like
MKLSMYGVSVLASIVGLVVVSTAAAAAVAVPLATTGSFSVLAGAGITNTGPTTVTGDIGTFPTTSISGLGSLTVGGANHAGDAVTQQAKIDLVTAYNTAAGEGPTNPIAADLGGRTLLPGVYNSASSIGLTGALTLNAQGNPNSVFVFQAGSALTSASGSQINLINGAQACNVYWQIGSSATLGTGSTFIGTVIALQSITVTTGVKIDGRVLARNGAVTLDTDTITTSTCATTPGSTTPGATTPGATTPGATPGTTLTPAAKKKLAAKKKALKKKQTIAKKTPTTKVVTSAKPPVHVFGFTG